MQDADLDPHIRRALETFNKYEIDRHMEEFAAGATFRDPVLDEPVTGDDHREYLADVIEAFPDISQDVDRVLIAQEATVLESTFSGTHKGPLEGIPPTGETATVPLVSIITVSENGITSWRDYWDQQTFRDQLGLTFPAIFHHLPTFIRWKLHESL
ncbi:MAG: ester cyclase [Halobacteriales archaeon]